MKNRHTSRQTGLGRHNTTTTVKSPHTECRSSGSREFGEWKRHPYCPAWYKLNHQK